MGSTVIYGLKRGGFHLDDLILYQVVNRLFLFSFFSVRVFRYCIDMFLAFLKIIDISSYLLIRPFSIKLFL